MKLHKNHLWALFLVMALKARPLLGVPTVTWFYRGSVVGNSTTLSFNEGDAVVLTCAAQGTTSVSQLSTLSPVFVITLDSPVKSYTMIQANKFTAPFTLFGLSTQGGTLVYDTVNGVEQGYDHFLVIETLPSTYVSATRGIMTIYIPSIDRASAGTFYCNFIEGNTFNAIASLGFSGSLTLSVQAKVTKAAQSRTVPSIFKYSSLILSCSKLLV